MRWVCACNSRTEVIKSQVFNGRALFGGSLWLVLASGMANLGLLLFNLAMIRVYGFGVHGRIVFYLSVISILRLVMDAGIGSMMTKEIGNKIRPIKSVLKSGIGWTLLFSFPVIALIAFDPGLFVGPDRAEFGFFSLWFFAMSVENIAASVFNGLQAMHLTFFSCLMIEGTKFSLVGYLWFVRPDIHQFILVANLGIFIAALFITILLVSSVWNIPSVLEKRPPDPSAFLLSAVVLWVPTAAAAIFPQAMTILIKFGLSESQVSYYTAIASWSLIGAVILNPAANALFAWTTRNNQLSTSSHFEGQVGTMTQYFRWTGIISMGCSLSLLAASEFILKLYGGEVLNLWRVFVILVLAQFADYPRFFTVPYLSGGNHPLATVGIEIGRFILSLVASEGAILAGFGLIGIAWAILGVQFLCGVARIFHIRKWFSPPLFPLFLRNLTAVGIAVWATFARIPNSIEIPLLVILFMVFSGVRVADFKGVFRTVGRL